MNLLLWRNMLPFLIAAGVVGIGIGCLASLVPIYLHFKRNIKYHLPETARDEIAERDAKIVELSADNKSTHKELEDLKGREQAALAFTHRILQALSDTWIAGPIEWCGSLGA